MKALRAVGARSESELLGWMNAPGRSVQPRPSLQVAQFLWTNNKSPVIFNSGGTCMLFSSYPYGSSDFQRHNNQTVTYKMQSLMQVCVPSNLYGYTTKYDMYWWLVYDKSPTGVAPSTSTIFDATYNDKPIMWTIGRDVCHRFVV